MATETELQFDGWTVNRVSGEISREGRGARLPQQPLRILLELADHAGDIVTREQLVKVLWPAGIVDFDNGLNVAVRKLRVALDDVADTPKYIETLPKVGYRFIGQAGELANPVLQRITRMSARARVALVLTLTGLAVAIAASWWLDLFGPHTGRVASAEPRHTPSVRAQELYLEGIHNRSRRDIDASALAVASFKAALKEDPDYAQAWAALGETISVAVVRQQFTPRDGVPKALAAVRRAIELDDNGFEGHQTLGEIYMDHERNYAAADQEFRRALALNDRSARLWHHMAMWHAHQGHVEEALKSIRRARELDPMTPIFAANYAMILYNARRYDEALEFLKPVVAANPVFDQARGVLAYVLMATGDLPGAEEQLRLRKGPEVFQGAQGVLYAKQGRREDAMREIERLDALGREGFGIGYEQAAIYAALGDLDHGCEALARAVDDHSILLGWMRLDPHMDPLRGRQCFADVEKRVYRK
jgi:DNA-binding winged helix-turn-helix (wHTH) protein/tetratricopeptide (TPR) repeat protein